MSAPPHPPSTNAVLDARIEETAPNIHVLDTIDDNTSKAAVDSFSSITEPNVTRNLSTFLDSPETQKLIEESIKRLAERTFATRAAFEDISILLCSFDSEKFKTNNGTEIGPLGPYWDELKKRHHDVLKESRNNAVVIKSVSDDYVETVLPITNEPGVDLGTVKDRIDDFIRRTDEARKEAESNACSLDQLRQDVNNYKKEIYDILTSAEADPEGLQRDVELLNKKISILEGLKAQLIQMEALFNDIVMHLGALTQFGQSVDAQCQEALINLNKGMYARTAFSAKKLLGDHLTGLSYRALSQALATYVSYMTQLG